MSTTAWRLDRKEFRALLALALFLYKNRSDNTVIQDIKQYVTNHPNGLDPDNMPDVFQQEYSLIRLILK